MTMAQTKQEISEANRRRYEELRAAGQELTPKALPEATALDGASIAPGNESWEAASGSIAPVKGSARNNQSYGTTPVVVRRSAGRSSWIVK